MRPLVVGWCDDDRSGRGMAGEDGGMVVAVGLVPGDGGQLDAHDPWVLAAALDDATNVGTAGAVAVDVRVVDGAAVADLLQTVVGAASVAGVPAPAPHVVDADGPHIGIETATGASKHGGTVHRAENVEGRLGVKQAFAQLWAFHDDFFVRKNIRMLRWRRKKLPDVRWFQSRII